MTGRHTVKIGRIYEKTAHGDGARVLVDRPWPRGLIKQGSPGRVVQVGRLFQGAAHLVPPHPDKAVEFGRRYRLELEEPERAAALTHLRDLATHGPLTLPTASVEAG